MYKNSAGRRWRTVPYGVETADTYTMLCSNKWRRWYATDAVKISRLPIRLELVFVISAILRRQYCMIYSGTYTSLQSHIHSILSWGNDDIGNWVQMIGRSYTCVYIVLLSTSTGDQWFLSRCIAICLTNSMYLQARLFRLYVGSYHHAFFYSAVYSQLFPCHGYELLLCFVSHSK